MNRTMKLFASLTLTGATLGQLVPYAAAGPGHEAERRDGVVYVVTNPSGPNAVESFLRDGMTGRLTRKGRYLTGGQGDAALAGAQSHAVVSDGDHLYVVNPGSDDISAFEIKHDGSLKLLGRTASQGRRPVSLALHDRLLYVANEGNIPFVPPALPGSYSGFRIRPNGNLDPIANSTVPVPAGENPIEIMFNQDGSRVVAARIASGVVDSFHVDDDSGNLVAKSANVPADSGPGSLDIALDPSGRFLYRLRGLSVPTPGAAPIVPQLDAYKVTGLDTDGGLNLVQTLTLPADLSTASVTGVIALDL